MKRKEFSHQLYTRKFKESNSFNSSYYVIYFGDRPVHKYIEEFPDKVKTPTEKRYFIEALINLYDERRERRNKLARERYHRKKKQTEKIPYKHIARRSYKIKTTRKIARGVFNPKKFVFRHTLLTYKRPLAVNHNNKREFEELMKALRVDFIKALDRALSLKGGMHWWMFKIITPFYDSSGNLMMSDDLEDQKTGKKYKTKTKYSYGYSVGATGTRTRENLIKHIDFTLESWAEQLKEKYINMTSRIEVSDLLVERKLSEEKL